MYTSLTLAHVGGAEGYCNLFVVSVCLSVCLSVCYQKFSEN